MTAEISIDFEVPYCVDCKHYLASKTGSSWGKCDYLEVRNLVSGEMENLYCENMREGRKSWDTDASMALRCDVNGKFFEAKPFVEVPPPPVQIEHAKPVPSDFRESVAREIIYRASTRSRATRRKPSLMTRIFGV